MPSEPKHHILSVGTSHGNDLAAEPCCSYYLQLKSRTFNYRRDQVELLGIELTYGYMTVGYEQGR